MFKRTVLVAVTLMGAIAAALVALSGLGAFLLGGGRAAFDDPTIIWFAPLFLTPAGLVGVVMVLIGSLVAKKRRRLLGWSVLATGVLLAATAATFTLTGLSTGEIELVGTFWGTTAVVVTLVYALSLLVVGGVGVLVVKDIVTDETAEAVAPDA